MDMTEAVETETLDEIIETAIEIAGADFGSIQLLDATTGDLWVAARRGLPKWWADYWDSVPRGQGAFGLALERGERIIVEDVNLSPVFVGTPALDIQLRAGIRSVQSTPIVSRSATPLGMLSTYCKAPHRPPERTLRLLDLLARQVSDTMHRTQSEVALRASEQRLRLALDAAKLGTWEWNVATNAVTWSPRQFELFGIRPEDFAGTSEEVLATVHPEDRANLDEAVRQARYGQKPLNVTFRVVHNDGTVHWLAGMAQMLKLGSGGMEHMIGVNLDVTEEKKAVELLQQLNKKLEEQVADRTAKLRDQASRLQAILETALIAIVTLDENGIIQSVNPAVNRIFGYTAGEVIGQSVTLLVPLPDRRAHGDPLRTGIRRFVGTTREAVARRKDGSSLPALLAVNTIPELKLYVAILLDITRQKELEREVLEIASLEDQRIGQDLHDDIGQELTALGLLANALAEIVRERLPDDVALAEKIELKTRRAIAKVRTIARGLAVAELAPDGLPAALAELVSRLSETSQIRFVLQCDQRILLADSLQSTHLFHIAQEACTNALKHSAARNVAVSLHVANAFVTLQVQDDGNGIAADAVEGLGQRIMCNRAKVIGAKLAIQSRQPRGTIVECILSLEQFAGR